MADRLRSQPTQTCTTCGRVQVVRPDGRGFPPDIAERRLAKRCKTDGCPSTPTYRAGVRTSSYRATGSAHRTDPSGREPADTSPKEHNDG